MRTIRILSALAVLVLVAFGSICLAAEAKPPPPLPDVIGPYLQNPAPDAMTVCYLTAGPGEVEVLHGASTPDTGSAALGTPIPGTPWTIWKARITGLQTGAAHTYRVTWNDKGGIRATSPPATFTTPDPGGAETRMIVVVAPHGEQLDPSSIKAFITKGGQGINYHIGTWHLPIIALKTGQQFLLFDRGGPEKNCDLHYFPEEQQITLLPPA